jgi:protein ImuB
MSRIMTIWLPRWPVQRRLLERPEWRSVPVFVCRREGRGVMRVVSWLWAQASRHRAGDGAEGMRPVRIAAGTSLAEAMAMLSLAHGSRACHAAVIECDDPVADRLALEKLARWCRRFAPIVAVEAGPRPDAHPECLFVDVTGTADFFGGEEALARTAAWTLTARGMHARVAIADTPGASWAAAHFTHLFGEASDGGMSRSAPRGRWPRRWAVVPGRQTTETAALQPLAALPAAALRLDDQTRAALAEVGIASIGDVLRLPRKSLASRFGPLLDRRLAQASGVLAEPLQSPAVEDLPQAVHGFDAPLALRDSGGEVLVSILERLVGHCVAAVAAQGKGITSLQVRLERGCVAAAAGGSSAPVVIDVGTFRPSASAAHLVDLTRLRLARLRLPREIEGMAVEVISVAAADCRQRVLFGGIDTAGDAGLQVAMLLDRLAGRLGRGAVFEPQSVADAQPEHAWVATPVGARSSSAAVATIRGRSSDDRAGGHQMAAPRFSPAGRRPVWMLPRPVRLETVSIVPVANRRLSPADGGPPLRFRWNGETHQVACAHGPERIETAWWRGPCVRRDYYVVETHTAGRYWLFRRLRDGAWFLHGVFA